VCPGPEQQLSRGRPRSRPFLRTAVLDPVGYAALAAACLLAGSLTALALRAAAWPLPPRAAAGWPTG
jgi:hypothetical protein